MYIMYINMYWFGEQKTSRRPPETAEIIPPFNLYLMMVNAQVRRTRCVHCERGYEFIHNEKPTHLSDLYVLKPHFKCSIRKRIDNANEL